MELWEVLSSHQKKNTLCWSCKNCEGGCSWLREFKPVEGWEALHDVKKNDAAGRGDLESYLVLLCPEYVKGRCTGVESYEGAEQIVIEVAKLLADEYEAAYKNYLASGSVTRKHLDMMKESMKNGLLAYMDIDVDNFCRKLEREVERGQAKTRGPRVGKH